MEQQQNQIQAAFQPTWAITGMQNSGIAKAETLSGTQQPNQELRARLKTPKNAKKGGRLVKKLFNR